MRKNKQKRRHRTALEMYAHIRAWESGGQPQRAYTSAHGLPKSVFTYWLRRYRQENQPRFVEVSAAGVGSEPPRAAGDVFARLQTPQGAELVLYEAVSAAYLRELLW